MFRYAPLGKEQSYTRCYRCGDLLGMSRSVMYAFRPSPVNFVTAMVNRLGELRHEMALRWSDGNQSYCQRCRKNSNWKDDLPFSEPRPAREDALGLAVLPRLLADAPFAVYGLKGNPLGLRLRDLDWSGRGPGRAILRYTAGEPGPARRALDLYQGADASQQSADERLLTELRSIIGLVLGCASTEQREIYLSRGNVHRYWNLDYVSRAPRRNVTIQIDGKGAEVELAHWQEPQLVVLARLAPGGRPAMAVSLGFSQTQLLGLLKSLVALRQDADALAQHEQDYRRYGP